MKKQYNIAALLLAILLFIRMMAVPLVYVDYNLRKDYIVQNLCENRFRPDLHCNGKCYLAKRVAAADQKETSEKGMAFARILLEIPCIVPSINHDLVLENDIIEIKKKCSFPIYNNNYSSIYFHFLLKPPTVA
ncbi:hypothetical protein [Flectobacillus sp. BAB-3569]|uniref:hypothetical protein n=1 Tax=Flectobacillus sp. BAB-3569 TaxID=1509483 RepID=UPI000BA2EF42|nr:hypothetical protein [Flectobacillus sp. BAB-3569]PAC28919.1 hypothetical protein BWI92_18010 [Flectobacillus sp. BAB-3569]